MRWVKGVRKRNRREREGVEVGGKVRLAGNARRF